MDLFGNPVSVLMALLSVVTCFGMTFAAAIYLIKKMDLFEQVKRELRERKFQHEQKGQS